MEQVLHPKMELTERKVASLHEAPSANPQTTGSFKSKVPFGF
jgi:hypothetical protein